MSAPVANLLHGGCMVLFLFCTGSHNCIIACGPLLFYCRFIAYLLRATPFYPLWTTFYFVLLLSSTLFYNLLALSFTPCYSTSFYSVLLRFTLFYPLRTTFYSVLLYSTPRTFPSATPFYHSLTTFFYFVSVSLSVCFLTLIYCYPVPVLLFFSTYFASISLLLFSSSCRIIDLFEVVFIYIWLPFLASWTSSTAPFSSLFPVFSPPFHPVFCTLSSLFSPL